MIPAGPAGRQPDVAAAAEAFLAGRYRAYLEGRGEAVPAWAWVNELARGGRTELEELAALRKFCGGPKRLVGALAAGLAGLDDARLQRVQRQRLEPLESVLRDLTGDPPASEADLAQAILTGLRGPGPTDGRP